MSKYIISSCLWSFTCDIDWSVYASVCNQNYHCPTFFLKWTHHLLTVGHVADILSLVCIIRLVGYTRTMTIFLLACMNPVICWNNKWLRIFGPILIVTVTILFLCDILFEGIHFVLHSNLFPFLTSFPCLIRSHVRANPILAGQIFWKFFFCSIHWHCLHNQFSSLISY